MAMERPTSNSVTARWESGYRAVVKARNFELIVDEPEWAEGTDTGPMPTEYLLASLASCFALSLGFAARKRNIDIGPFDLHVVGHYDGPSFQNFEIHVKLERPAPDNIDVLLAHAKRVCYVSNTLARTPDIAVVLE